MRTSLFAATAALALLAAPVLAQSPGAAPRAPGGAPAGATAVPRAPMPNPLTQEDVSRIKGTDVYGTDDKKLGSIDTVLINPQSKTIDRLVVKAGGVLGVGGHDVAIPIDQFNWDTAKEGFKLAKTTDELKAMPEWKSASASIGRTSSGSSGMPSAPSSTGTGSATPGVPASK